MSIPSYFIQSPVVNVDVTDTSKIVFLPPVSSVLGNTFLIRDSTGSCSAISSIFISTLGLDTIDYRYTNYRMTNSLQSARFVTQSGTNYSAFQNYTAGFSPYLWDINPSTLAECTLWYNAANAQSILANGLSTLRWSNLGIEGSADLYHNSTVTGYPNYGVETMNVLPTVSFSTISSSVLASGLQGPISISNAETTAFYVFKSLADQTQLTNYPIGILYPEDTNGFQVTVNIYRQNFYYQLEKKGAWTMSAGTNTNPFNTPQMITLRNTSNLGSNFIHINGYNVTLASNAVANGFNTSSLSYFMSDPMNTPIPPYNYESRPPNTFAMGEFVLYNRALLDREVTLIERYLKSKWNILGSPSPIVSFIVPTDIPNCEFWFDPTNLSSITFWRDNVVWYLDNLGTYGGSAYATNVFVNVVESGVGKISGENTLLFTGDVALNRVGMISWYEYVTVQQKTMFFVLRPVSGIGLQPFYLIGGSPSPDIGNLHGQLNVYVSYDSNTGLTTYSVSSYGVWTLYAVDSLNINTTPILLTIRISTDMAENRIRVNRVSETIVDNHVADFTTGIGIDYTFNYAQNSTAVLGELILYSSVLSDGQMNQVETYLSAKWGIY